MDFGALLEPIWVTLGDFFALFEHFSSKSEFLKVSKNHWFYKHIWRWEGQKGDLYVIFNVFLMKNMRLVFGIVLGSVFERF